MISTEEGSSISECSMIAVITKEPQSGKKHSDEMGRIILATHCSSNLEGTYICLSWEC